MIQQHILYGLETWIWQGSRKYRLPGAHAPWQLTGMYRLQGQELGSFLYGGSTVITLFRRGAIKYDADLQHNSRQRIETLVRMGTSLGIAL